MTETLAENNMPISICIPHLFTTITKEQINKVFNGLQLGDIESIDLHVGKDFQRAFIHFRNLYSTEHARCIIKRFKDGETLKVIYNDPWFWKCSISRAKKYTARTGPRYVSKYNSKNQIIALKKTLTEERRRFAAELEAKDEEIKELNSIINELLLSSDDKVVVPNDESLLRRKRVQQRLAAWMQDNRSD